MTSSVALILLYCRRALKKQEDSHIQEAGIRGFQHFFKELLKLIVV